MILIFSVLNNEHMLGEEYSYPDWAYPLGWVLTGSSVMCIPLYMIYKFDRTRGGFKRVSFIEVDFYDEVFFCSNIFSPII